MNTTELAKGVYWVGAVDRDIPPSSGYAGTSYNAYLIIDEKITLVDGVKYSHREEFWKYLRAIIDPEKIDYYIVNHVEPDHSSSMPEIVETIKPEKIFCSSAGKDAIIRHFHNEDWPYVVVKNGDELSLGKRTVQFIMTSMVHWPDSMFSYLKEDGILFSNDAFGQHLATDERFDDEVDFDMVLAGARFFYANNLNLLSPKIKKLLLKMKEMDLGIKIVAPDHGLILRTHHQEMLDAYYKWSCQEHQEEALVVYDTKWKSTEIMAKAIAEGITEGGVPATLCSLKEWHRGAVMERLLTASTLVVGSPTINNSTIPSIAAFMHFLKGLRPKNKVGAAFGSYGWGGEAVRHITNDLEELKMELVDDGLRVKFVPNEEQLQGCIAYGRRIAKATKEFVQE